MEQSLSIHDKQIRSEGEEKSVPNKWTSSIDMFLLCKIYTLNKLKLN